jgi:hypothetical protein
VFLNETILTVKPEHLATLDPVGAVTLAAELLWAEARRINLPTTEVQISLRVTVPDGGIDASVTPADASILVGSFLPSGRSAFQIKAGQSFEPWQESAIREELFGKQPPSKANLGASVRDCLEANGTYIFFCTKIDPVKEQQREAVKHLQHFFGLCGFPNAKVYVWGQETIIGILKRFPSLALRLNGRGKSYFLTHAMWSKQAEMGRPFKAGPRQKQFIETLQNLLRQSDGPVHIRVRGEAGIGKTRLVHEATAADDLRPLVIYCDTPSQLLDSELMSEFLREGTNLSAILVVDECDVERRAAIWNQLQFHSPRIRFVSVYNDLDEPSGTTVVQDAPPLELTQITEIIQEYGAPQNEASRWAELCDGSPRVAHVIGQNLKTNPGDILRPPDTANVWGRYVAQGDDMQSTPARERQVVLRHLALFKRFGFGAAVDTEAKAIAKVIETRYPAINWPRFQEIIKFLRDRKILQGETTLYITPTALHIRLWADWWDTYGDGFDPLQFTEQLPGQLGDWFREMFQYAAQSKAALKITEELLNEKGRFGKIAFFENRRGARFFLALTNAAPEAALNYLQRTIGIWDVARLSEFGRGRREVVWALERIAVWRTLFTGAAQLLLKLAEAENEDIANNATGVFVELFSPAVGLVAPTEAPLDERFPVLKAALESSSKRRRSIAIKACEMALQTSDFHRLVGAEFQGLRVPPKLWTPATWGEVFSWYRRVWQLLEDNLGGFDSDDFYAAIGVVTSRTRGLTRIASLTDMLVTTLTSLAQRYPISRAKIIEAVELVIRYEGKTWPRDRLEPWIGLRGQLTEKNFHTRMERYVGMALLQDEFDEKGNTVDKVGPKVVSLAREIADAPSLIEPELPWLVTGAAKNGYRFGRELATVDQRFGLKEKIIDAQRKAGPNGNVFFLSGYFSVMFERDPEQWEKTLDTLQGDESLRRYLPEITWRSGMTERAAIRILSMAQVGVISPEQLRMFSFGGVVRKVPERVFIEWIRHLLKVETRTAAWVALDLFFFYYSMGETKLKFPRDLALAVLTAESFFTRTESKDQMEEYEWTQLAMAFIRKYPRDGTEIAQPLLRTFGEEGTVSSSFRSETSGVLEIVVKQNPIEAWAIIAGYLGPPADLRSYNLAQWLRNGALSLIPPEAVFDWIEKDPTQLAPYVATFVPPILTPPQQKEFCWARELLVRYGDREDVRSNLYANFSTEGWVGPTSAHYLNKKQWLDDLRKAESDPKVIAWIDEYADSLRRAIELARVEEERQW